MTLPKRKFTAADLIVGKTYRVIKEFKEYGGTLHPVGEHWKYFGKSFLPYEDGLSLFIEKGGMKIQVRLQWREETQGPIIDSFSDFMEEI